MNPILLRSARFAGKSVLVHENDERLAELARAGSHDAFEAIVARHRAILVRQCARIVGEAEAEEAVQEALIKAHASLTAGNHIRTVGPWLRTIAQNTSLSMLRARAARPAGTASECECLQHTDDAAEHREEFRDVLAAVASLPDRQREAIVMREFEGRSYEEIAASMGSSDGAVRGLLGRARLAIRGKVAALPGFEPVLRWLSGGSGAGVGRVGALSGGCALTIKVCAAVLPVVPVGIGALSIGSKHPGTTRAAASNRTNASASSASTSAGSDSRQSATRRSSSSTTATTAAQATKGQAATNSNGAGNQAAANRRHETQPGGTPLLARRQTNSQPSGAARSAGFGGQPAPSGPHTSWHSSDGGTGLGPGGIPQGSPGINGGPQGGSPTGTQRDGGFGLTPANGSGQPASQPH